MMSMSIKTKRLTLILLLSKLSESMRWSLFIFFSNWWIELTESAEIFRLFDCLCKWLDFFQDKRSIKSEIVDRNYEDE